MVKRTWDDANMGGAGGGSNGEGMMLPTPAPLTPSKPEDQSNAPNRESLSGLGSFRNGDIPFPQISRNTKACVACRKHKTKCLMNERGPPCRRCAERNLGCVLNKSLQKIIDDKSQLPEAVAQDLDHIHGALKKVLNKLGLRELPPLQCPTACETEGSLRMDHSRSRHQSPSLPAEHRGPSCDNSPKATPEDEGLPYVPIHSLYTLTKLSALRSPEDTEAAQRGRRIDDFITRKSIALADAESLFALYRDRLDRYMYSIGCRYQTLEELRQKSPILSAATLTVAALHTPKSDNLYGVCSSEFRRLMEKSMFERCVDQDYLRALCVASYWLSDISWMLSGYAIRRAAECNLRNSYNQAIKERSQGAADCVRLWYILYICDQHLATLYGRPSIVQEDSSIQGWEKFLESAVATKEDKRLMGQVALVSILRSIRELFGYDKGEPIPRVYINHISHFRRQLDQWYEQWTRELPEQWPQIGSFPRKGTILHYNFAQIHLYSHVFRGLSGDDLIPHYLFDCALKAIAAATAIIDLIISDPDVATGIVGMPSYMHSMTAFACVFLIKVALKYGGDLVERERVCDLITSLVRQFRSQPVGKWHLANLMTGGLERMLEMLNTAALGRRPLLKGMVAGTGISDSVDAPGQMLGVDSLFPDLDGGLFFDHDMSFGLSAVFQFDPRMPSIHESAPMAQVYADPDYETRPPP